MRFVEAMIAWNPNSDQIVVGPWPDTKGWSEDYFCTDGACMMSLHKQTPDQQQRTLFIAFNTIVVRDNVPMAAVHRAFLKIDEYRCLIAPDLPGAEP